jgi:hypothetical protein
MAMVCITIRMNVDKDIADDIGTKDVCRVLRELADEYDGSGFHVYEPLLNRHGDVVGATDFED